ncbi:ORC1-type DNA replication protein [archaeon]|nr:ORC1-type DNA replication protein [archaeon]
MQRENPSKPEKDLTSFFEDYIKKEPLFINKKVLQASYTPETIPHREKEIQKVANILAPALRNEKPSNLFLYGTTGTGKTLVIQHVINKIELIAKKNSIPIKIVYLNCKLKRIADTEYRIIAELARGLDVNVPATGLPTDEVYKLFIRALEKERRVLIIVLDEIDQLVNKAGDEILYNLTRLHGDIKTSEISIIGISNDLTFTNELDPRVKSSLSEEELSFHPYNALQLQSILRERAEKAFNKEVINQGVLEKCAAYAAREHGDARRALELLRVAGELAERKNAACISMEDIDFAEEKIEKDLIHEVILSQPKHSQTTLLSIFLTYQAAKEKPFSTGEVFDVYRELCHKIKMQPLTQRRISDLIAELDMLGIINTKVISKGRYGRTRQIKLELPPSAIPKLDKMLRGVLCL